MILRKIYKNNKGFTLIELLVSVTILSILILSFLSFFNQAYDYTKRNENKTVGINVARNTLMFLQNESYIKVREIFKSNPESGNFVYICGNEYQLHNYKPPTCNEITINNLQFQVKVNSPNYDITKENYYFPVKVDVKWKNGETSLEGVVKSEDI
jgi:prepilin-type N-terminal cleavage/methylation domain-containing protein